MKRRFQNLKEHIINNLASDNELTASKVTYISLLDTSNCQGVSELYQNALLNGDWIATEYSHIKDFQPDRDFFAQQAALNHHIWFVFSNQNGEVIGSTKLGLCQNGSVIIDETQLNPQLGQGRNIIQSYFKKFVPMVDEAGFNYYTEFIFSLSSRSLRKTLLKDLGMYVTGIRPYCYTDKVSGTPIACLTAHAPYGAIKKILQELISKDLPKEVKGFLQVLLGENSQVDIPSNKHVENDYKGEAIVPITNTAQMSELIGMGYRPFAVDPCNLLIHLYDPKNELASQLWYLERERNESVTRIARYLLNCNQPLKKQVK